MNTGETIQESGAPCPESFAGAEYTVIAAVLVAWLCGLMMGRALWRD